MRRHGPDASPKGSGSALPAPPVGPARRLRVRLLPELPLPSWVAASADSTAGKNALETPNQCSWSNLQNLVGGIEEVTIFLDTRLRFRSVAPATHKLFGLGEEAVGRGLADLPALAVDAELHEDAAAVLAGGIAQARHIATPGGARLIRGALPYHARNGKVAGVVVTFADVTAPYRSAVALAEARKTSARPLGAAPVEMPQHLHTITLLRAVLDMVVLRQEAPPKLVAMQEMVLATTLVQLRALRDGTGPPGAALMSATACPSDPAPAEPPPSAKTVYVVEHDAGTRNAFECALQSEGQTVVGHASAEAFLDTYRPGGEACLLADVRLPGIGGLELLETLRAAGDPLPAIMVSDVTNVTEAVQAMKSGASDFLPKPVPAEALRTAVDHAMTQSRGLDEVTVRRRAATGRLARLTARQREVMLRVLAGEPTKNIAADLGIGMRTVETHRAEIMHRTGAKSLPALARLVLAAEPTAFVAVVPNFPRA